MSGTVSTEIHARARDGFTVYAAGINQALSPNREFLVGNDVTLADICFVAEWSLFHNERTNAGELEKRALEPILHAGVDTQFPLVLPYFSRLVAHPAFAPDVQPYLKKIEAGSAPAAARS
jgi:elongation factor 1-gamma